jgi:hypothetical protein
MAVVQDQHFVKANLPEISGQGIANHQAYSLSS